MKLEIICNGELVNEHSDGGRHYGWNNPFEKEIPVVGDILLLGEHTKKFTHLEFSPMKKYVVKSREFSAIEDYNHRYSEAKCRLLVDELN